MPVDRMRTRAQKWGNSLAVRIPKAIADKAGVREEDEVEIEVSAQVIRMKARRREPTLSELLRRITPDNLHGEADFGRPQGREAW
jgi:antitoxin MazE